MLKKVVLFICCYTTLFCLASYGKCYQIDAKGTWYFYAFGSTSGGHAFWNYGSVVVLDDGSINPGTYFVTSSGDYVEILGGKISVSLNCLISGTIRADNGVVTYLKRGALDRNKIVISGVFENNYNQIGMIIGIKR